jgi:hypothetical protein
MRASPTLLLPEGQQEIPPFERGGHLCRLALLEVQFPAGIIGIGPVRDFGMARDRETVRLKELDGLTLAGWPLDFSRKHPTVGVNGGEVTGFDPAHAFSGMPSFSPAPQTLEDRMIGRLKHFGADDMPVIQCPSANEGIEQTDQGAGSGALVGFDDGSDFAQERLNALRGGFNEQLAVVLAQVLTEEVYTLVD